MNTEPTWSDSPIHEQIRTMSTDTPETFKSVMWSELGWTVDIDFARKLERERDEAREQHQILYEQTGNTIYEARKQRDRLAEALRELCIALLTDKSPDITDLLNKAGAAMADVNYSTAKKSQP